LERAVDWIFSHAEEIATMEAKSSDKPKLNDGPGSEWVGSSNIIICNILEYELMAFISHMGTSTMCGHYVCHIKKEGR